MGKSAIIIYGHRSQNGGLRCDNITNKYFDNACRIIMENPHKSFVIFLANERPDNKPGIIPFQKTMAKVLLKKVEEQDIKSIAFDLEIKTTSITRWRSRTAIKETVVYLQEQSFDEVYLVCGLRKIAIIEIIWLSKLSNIRIHRVISLEAIWGDLVKNMRPKKISPYAIPQRTNPAI